jgi:hypothetical protein
MLDGGFNSSIEWQASLLISQLLNVSLNASQTRADKPAAKTKRESRLLDKDLKAADNSASVLITAQTQQTTVCVAKFFKN